MKEGKSLAASERLLIKHAVTGKMLLDSDAAPVSFTLKEEQPGWTFEISLPDPAAAEPIVRLRHELNVFRFETLEDGTIRKNWYYVKDGVVRWDEAARKLVIYADSHITYLPTDYYA